MIIHVKKQIAALEINPRLFLGTFYDGKDVLASAKHSTIVKESSSSFEFDKIIDVLALTTDWIMLLSSAAKLRASRIMVKVLIVTSLEQPVLRPSKISDDQKELVLSETKCSEHHLLFVFDVLPIESNINQFLKSTIFEFDDKRKFEWNPLN